MVAQTSIGGKHGEVVVEGDIVSVKITPDRTVWFRWNEKSKHFTSTNRKVNKGLTRAQKELWLVQYKNLLLDEWTLRGREQANIKIADDNSEDEGEEQYSSDSQKNDVEVKN